MRRACSPIRLRSTDLAAAALLVAAALAGACGDDGEAPSGTGGMPSSSTVTGAASTSAASTGGDGGAGAAGQGDGGGGRDDGDGGQGGAVLPSSFEVEGIVTDGTSPVAGASVLQGGGDVQVVTTANGSFTIVMSTALPGIPTVVAGKRGFRSAGIELDALPAGPLEIVLLAAEPPDNEGYVFGEPGNGDPGHDASTDFCGHCHTTFAATFQASAHARATSDPWLHDLYAGVASARDTSAACDAVGGEERSGTAPGSPGASVTRCYVGDGVLPDLNDCGAPGDLACDDPALADRPASFGACADCHAAGMDGPAGGRDLLEAEGTSFDNGNHCDVCHHVKDIDLDAPPGVGGRLILQRPAERLDDGPPVKRRQVMYGPFVDVPNGFMGGSVQPTFTEATFCAGCHEQMQEALLPGGSLDRGRWPGGLPIHSTFSEWQASAYAEAGLTCQGCHMPVISGMFNSVDVSRPEDASISAGFGRPPERNRSHAFVGALEGTPRMLEQAVLLLLDGARDGGVLSIDATLRNVGAGHAVPTGEPLRGLLLVVEVDACGERARAISGGSIGDVGGSIAVGAVGSDLPASSGSTVVWGAAAGLAEVGQRLRVTRATGEFLDYPGVGAFADPGLNAEEKGKPIRVPTGEVEIVAVDGETLTLDGALVLVDGDVVFLGDAPAGMSEIEGAPARALAGVPGRDLGRVTQDAAGRTSVPHHRAIDLVSDDRIPPAGEVVSSHGFAVRDDCDQAVVRATLLYRRAPFALGRERGWDLREHVAATREIVVALER